MLPCGICLGFYSWDLGCIRWVSCRLLPVPHSQTFEALVLKTYNVGEADRYCILFTRERGRMAVRARGVRKLKSRKGGSLIPYQLVTVEVRESAAGLEAVSASPTSEQQHMGLQAFADASQGFEVLLRLTQDDEPLPAVFSASISFLHACDQSIPHASLAYTFRLLSLLGFLPDTEKIMERFTLNDAEQQFLQMARDGFFLRNSEVDNPSRLERVRDRFLHDQLAGPLKAPGVVAAMEQ